jgi:hypothetical protein
MLLPSTITNNIRAYTDPLYSGFTEFPANETEAIEALANAFYQYSLTIVPVCVTQAAARDAMKFALVGMSAPSPPAPPGTTAAIITAAASAFASALLMVGYTPVPPPAGLNLSSVATIGLAGGSAEACAIELGTVIDAWFRTETATNGTTTINWQ